MLTQQNERDRDLSGETRVLQPVPSPFEERRGHILYLYRLMKKRGP